MFPLIVHRVNTKKTSYMYIILCAPTPPISRILQDCESLVISIQQHAPNPSPEVDSMAASNLELRLGSVMLCN